MLLKVPRTRSKLFLAKTLNTLQEQNCRTSGKSSYVSPTIQQSISMVTPTWNSGMIIYNMLNTKISTWKKKMCKVPIHGCKKRIITFCSFNCGRLNDLVYFCEVCLHLKTLSELKRKKKCWQYCYFTSLTFHKEQLLILYTFLYDR